MVLFASLHKYLMAEPFALSFFCVLEYPRRSEKSPSAKCSERHVKRKKVSYFTIDFSMVFHTPAQSAVQIIHLKMSQYITRMTC